VPSGGEDRPSGTVEGDESVPSHGDASEDPGFNTKFTNEPPHDVEPALPPYAQPASGGSEADTDDDRVGPAHTGGAHRAEDRR
jgi:hypothetical protein